MITRDQLLTGLLNYADNEIMPHLPTHGKWTAGAVIGLLSTRYNLLMDEIIKNPMLKSIGLITDTNMLDVDAAIEALSVSADKYGPMTLSIPVVGNLIFKSDDVRKLKLYISG